ncbi:DUF2723 domain-containing protein [Candidatus Sumerlaeota bacterium]|nr:DUF2723 domain-containing protein [Candidatus Sumerlaeota bacterium]
MKAAASASIAAQKADIADRLHGPGDVLCAALVLLVYLLTANPGAYWGDGIELTTASHVLGVAHPTGYPLFMLLGKLFAMLPAGTIAYRLNLMCACAAASLAYCSIHVAWRMLREFDPVFAQNPALRKYIALGAGACVAFSRGIWLQAGICEVYLLNAAAIMAAMLLIIRGMDSRDSRWFAAAALLAGLAMGNQMLAICAAAALFAAILICSMQEKHRLDWTSRFVKRMAVCAVTGALGLGVYVYLPIRANAQPPMNWGAPVNMERTMETIRGGAYRHQRFMMETPQRPFTLATWLKFAGKRGAQFVRWELQGELPAFAIENRSPAPALLIGALMLVFPLLALWRLYHASTLFWPSCAAIGLNLFFVLTYNIPDIEGYFMPLAAWMLILAPGGVAFALRKILRDPRQTIAPAIYSLLAVPVILFIFNFTPCNYAPRHMEYSLIGDRAYAVENYGTEVLRIAAPNALLVTAGDNDIYTLWHLRWIEKRRPDIDIVGSNFLSMDWHDETIRTPVREADAPLTLIELPPVNPRTDDVQRRRVEDSRKFYHEFILPNLRQRPVYTLFPPNYPGVKSREYDLLSLRNSGVMRYTPERPGLPYPSIYEIQEFQQP